MLPPKHAPWQVTPRVVSLALKFTLSKAAGTSDTSHPVHSRLLPFACMALRPSDGQLKELVVGHLARSSCHSTIQAE